MARKVKRKALPLPKRQAAPVNPGPSEFSPEQEQAMRRGARQSRMADTGPPMQPLPPSGGGDDYGGI